ncbi:riboflavin synthase [Patescibacteria group bacterium]|nr:MAG: riboflavin synthase [Patescibacteria group bacterium]
MFGGIIRNTEKILSAEIVSSLYEVRISKPTAWRLRLGQSISIDGICSTISALGKTFFEVQYVPETCSRTTAKTFIPGRVVNVEQSITLRTLLDGHIISGHVDSVAHVTDFKHNEVNGVLTLRIPQQLMHYIVPQGSVAINGVSVTVQTVKSNTIHIALIPETLKRTNLGSIEKDSAVNLEIDILARYALRATLKPHAKKALRKKKTNT